MNAENVIRLEFPAKEVVEASDQGYSTLVGYFHGQLYSRYRDVVKLFEDAIHMEPQDTATWYGVMQGLADMIAMDARLLIKRSPLVDSQHKFAVVFRNPLINEPLKPVYWAGESKT
jgi:DhnA family fructose-bisphosphate aldolase class Ia